MKRTAAAIALGTALAGQAAEPTRFTEKCNTLLVNAVGLVVTDSFIDNLNSLFISDPQRHSDALMRLWEPESISPFVAGGNPMARLEYDPRQDIAQIAREIAADGVLRSLGVTSAQPASLSCVTTPVGGPIRPFPVTITEYHNRFLNHYFLSSSLGENAFIDSGWAGPGWERTGETFATITPNFCSGNTAVYRFYGPSARSHLFTPDAGECGQVRKPGTGWFYEGVAFGAVMPANGQCPQGRTPVWRLFNNRAAQNDSNHRYVSKSSLLSQMQLTGWVLEGLAYCF